MCSLCNSVAATMARKLTNCPHARLGPLLDWAADKAGVQLNVLKCQQRVWRLGHATPIEHAELP